MTKCIHKWVPSEGRTASGVLCSKCGDYNGPEIKKKQKLKVLPNPYQNSVSLWHYKNQRLMKEGKPPVEFSFTKHYPCHEVVFNRPGFYMTLDACWLEFDLGGAIIKAISYDRDHFERELDEMNQKEKLINTEDWHVIKKLLDRGLIDWTEQLIGQASEQSRKIADREFGKRFMASKKRLRQKIKERNND